MSADAMKNKGRARSASFWTQAAATLRSSRWPRRLAWALGAWLLLWVLAYALVPWVLKSQIEKMGAEKLGRQVTVGAIEFKPWSLELTLHDLAIAKAGAKAGATLPGAPPPSETAAPGRSPQLQIKRLYIDAELASLWRLAPVASAIQVEDPALSLTHLGAGHYDIDDILARLKTPTPVADSKPQQFGLYNLELTGGRVDFVDQSVHKTQELCELHLAVPFLSNLPSQLEIKTTPHLAFKLNGSRFDSAAESTPFAQTHKSEAQLTLHDFDLKPYLAYWPASLPFKLQSGVLQVDAKVAFEQTPATQLKLSGSVTADKVVLLEAKAPAAAVAATSAQSAGGPELLAFDRLHVTLDDVRPLDQYIKLSAIELTAPTLSVTRNRAGQLNLLPPGSPSAAKNGTDPDARKAPEGLKSGKPDSLAASTSGAPASAASAAAAAPKAVAKTVVPSWKVLVDKVAVRGGHINWLDESLASPARIGLTGLTLDASAIAMPFAASAPLQFKGALGLDAPLAAAPGHPAQLSFSGSATDQTVQLKADVAAWPLDMAAKYAGQFLLPALNGQLDAELGIHWQAGADGQPQALQITAPQLALSEVQLAQGKASLVSVKRIELAQVAIDVPGQSFKAAKIRLDQPKAKVERGTDQRWMYERWLVAQSLAAPAALEPVHKASSNAGQQPQAGPASWVVAIDDVLLDGGTVSFSDQGGVKPVALEISALKAQLGALRLDDRPAAKAQAAKPMPLALSLRVASGRFAPGKLDFKGSVDLTPLQLKGQLDASRLPVQAFEPYFGAALNIELLRADASFKGRLAYQQTAAGPQAEVAGDVLLQDFKANTLTPSEDLLAWKTLDVRGLNVRLDPAKAMRIDVKETVATDLFARVIIMPDGRINLQDLLKPTAASSTAAAAVPESSAVTPEIIAASAHPIRVTGLKGLNSSAAAASVSVPAAGSAPAELSPIINFGPISLINGQARFSDRFIKPNYSADLTELTGKLSAFSSETPRAADGTTGAPQMADLELRGKAEGTAALEILGKLNPLAKPLALDITAKVHDLELSPLSPYAIKYSGYGIERGKLSMDVNYVVLPNGQLTARNKLVLNQLSFGDKVAGSTASLPVKLAVALLADRNGVIDLDLPISGSLNDPQFSIGPVIVKVILNVIVKAITAPFSLLAHALGGSGEELSMVSFAPGSAQLSAEAQAGLDKVAKALVERPTLRLTVAGTSSLEAERESFKRERLDGQVRAEKRRQLAKSGDDGPQASVQVDAAEYPALLKEVYKRADFPKPRNLVGLTKDLPVAEMEKLLLSNIKVDEDSMRQLAVARGMAVKDYLASRGLAPERLFLGSAKTVPPEGKWSPRAELNLAMP